MAQEPVHRRRGEQAGASVSAWFIFFSSLAISVALVLQGSVRVEADLKRWWQIVPATEMAAYALALVVPPFSRIGLPQAIVRVLVGFAMRGFVVVLCALLLVIGGESPLVPGLKLFWAGHWPAAMGQIVCIAVAVYAFRVISLRRARPTQPRPASIPEPVPEPAVGQRTSEELLTELMADRVAAEAATEAAPPEPGIAAAPEAPLPAPPETAQAPAGPEDAGPAPSGTAHPPPDTGAGPPRAPRAPAPPPAAAIAAQPAPPEEPWPSLEELEPPASEQAPVEEPAGAESEPESSPAAEVEPEAAWLAPEAPDAEPAPSTPLEELPWTAVPEASEPREPSLDVAEPPQPDTTDVISGAIDSEALASGTIRLPAEVVLAALPEGLLAVAPERAAQEVPGGVLSFEWELVSPQLAGGQVWVPAQTLLSQLPMAILAVSSGQFMGALPAEGVELPLHEVVMRLPADVFGPPPDQTVDELLSEPPIFVEAGAEGPEAPPTASSAAPPIQTPLAPPEAEETTPAEPEAPAPEAAGRPWEEPSEEPSEPEPVAETDAEEPEADAGTAVSSAIAALGRRPAPQEAASQTEAPEPESEVDEESLVSSAIHALTQKRAEREPEEAGPPAADKSEPPEELHEDAAPEATPASQPEAPGLLTDAAVGAQPTLREPAGVPTEAPAHTPPPLPEEPLAEALEVSEPATETPAPPPPEAAPEPAPGEARPTLDAAIVEQLRESLAPVGCHTMDIAADEAVTVVTVHAFPSAGEETAQQALDIVRIARALSVESGAGALGSLLIIAEPGAAHIAALEGQPDAYLAVLSSSTSAGQASVAARRAARVLEGGVLETTGGGPVPRARLTATEDVDLKNLAQPVARGRPVWGFRAADGSGVIMLGLDMDAPGRAATAANELWAAAEATPIGHVQRVLVMGPSRTLGLAQAKAAGALVVAGFGPSMNPGLVGTETTKVVKECDAQA